MKNALNISVPCVILMAFFFGWKKYNDVDAERELLKQQITNLTNELDKYDRQIEAKNMEICILDQYLDTLNKISNYSAI